jgi:hypothetical protein
MHYKKSKAHKNSTDNEKTRSIHKKALPWTLNQKQYELVVWVIYVLGLPPITHNLRSQKPASKVMMQKLDMGIFKKGRKH